MRRASSVTGGALKAKGITRSELVELQSSVQRLERDSEHYATVRTESRQSVEYLATQIEALRKAYSTLSDVLIDEVDAVRADVRSVRSDAESRLRDVEGSSSRSLKSSKSLRVDSASMKEENAKLRGEIASLREAAAEDHAKSQATIRALEGEVGSLRNELHELRDMMAGSLTELKARADGHQVSLDALSERTAQLPRVLRSIDELRADAEESKRAADSLKTTVSAQADDLAQTKSDLSSLRSVAHQIREDSSTAATALAQDVSALAKDAAQVKAKNAVEREKVSAQLRAVGEAVESQNTELAEQLQHRLTNLGREVSSQHETLRQALFAVQKQQNRLRSSLEDGLRGAGTEVKSLESQISGVESAVAAKTLDIRKRLDEATDDSRRQFEAVSHAVHAFADILHVSSPLVSGV